MVPCPSVHARFARNLAEGIIRNVATKELCLALAWVYEACAHCHGCVVDVHARKIIRVLVVGSEGHHAGVFVEVDFLESCVDGDAADLVEGCRFVVIVVALAF